ncbi:hypothetical protein RI367_007526 [Sorochytrium milnesiophthora]
MADVRRSSSQSGNHTCSLPQIQSNHTLSGSTQQLLESMVKQTGMSHVRRKQLLQQANGSLCLPLSMKRPVPASADEVARARAPPAVALRYDHDFRPAKRSQADVLRSCENYKVDTFIGGPLAPSRDKEIRQLQKRMQRTGKKAAVADKEAADQNFDNDDEDEHEAERLLTRDARLRKRPAKAAETAEELDEVEELLREVRERREWLQEMEVLGLADKFRPKIQSEIKVRMAKLEKLQQTRQQSLAI